jgi:outer membrane cobalamin receptor
VRALILVALFSLAVAASAAAQSTLKLSGVVLDSSGAPVAGASVTAGGTTTTTAADGTFSLTAPAATGTVLASAAGFAQSTVKVPADTAAMRIVLQPAPLQTAVVVTASRGAERLSTPTSTTVVTSAELLNSAAGALDDALRGTPGFSLFRRSSSRVSNPTTQGVTLRGVSGSGASRTLVLADGTPLNDPFGSWVYWNRVPEAAVDRVEVVRGATGDLYGADALGGVVQVLTFAPGRTRARLDVDGGSLGTARFSGFASTEKHGWYGEGAGEFLRTDGTETVGAEVRGPVDIAANSDYDTGFVGGGYDIGTWHAGVRVSLYDEDRGNGTPLQVNSTTWKQVAGESGGTAGGGAWLVRASGGTQSYYQTFTAVAADRASERLTTEQTTPSNFFNASGQWTRAYRSVSFLAGAEAKRTKSTVQEFRYAFGTNVKSGPFETTGTESGGAVFARASFQPETRVTIVAGGRGDFWRSTPADTTLPTHSANFFSPRASAGIALGGGASLHAAVYRSYRTPSLNELYRGFRVGNAVTNPNAALDPERLTGVEGGVLYTRGMVSTRVTVYTNQLDNAITNVTLSTTPSLITRERENTQTLRSTGVEWETDLRPDPRWSIGIVVVGTDAHYAKTPEQPQIEGDRVPEVPTFQLGANLTYSDPHGFTGAVQSRAFGSTYDDDLNQFLLNGYGVVDVSASQQVLHGVNVFVAVENLFNKDYDTGRTPIRTIGWPRTARVGLRVFLP